MAKKKLVATKVSGYGNIPGAPKMGTPALQKSPILPGFTNQAFGGFTPSLPGQAATSSTAAAVAAPALSTGGGSSASTVDPRDPTYWTNIAKINDAFTTTNAQLDQQETQGRTDLTNNLAALDKQQPIDTSNARGTYNNSGLFYSTKLTGAEGDITSKYGDARTAANTGFNSLLNNININRTANQKANGAGGTGYADALNDASGRAVSAAQASAAAGGLAGPPPDPTNGSAALIQKWANLPYQQIDQGNGTVMHLYPDGTKKFVKAKK